MGSKLDQPFFLEPPKVVEDQGVGKFVLVRHLQDRHRTVEIAGKAILKVWRNQAELSIAMPAPERN